MTKKNKFYITTSLMYINSEPHLGFAWELAQADVSARYRRLKGDDVFFLTGADEYGKKIFEAAKKAGLDPQDFANQNSLKIKRLAEALSISNDFFIRTTDKERHWPTVEKIWGILKEKGDIYKKEYEGLYCVGCEAFKTNRELEDGKCPYHLKEPEIIKEENYFFKLSKYLDDVKKILQEDKIKIYPENRRQEALNMIDSKMGDLSVSRPSEQVSWGIPVPGDKSQNVYVWFEALLNYISAIGYAENTDNFKKYWPADTHLIGKDILKFHAIVWPAVLLATGIELPKSILVHGFITSAGQKMSKSLDNVVSPFEIITKYGADAFRYYFLAEASMFSDVDFTKEKFDAKYNADLAGGLGNLVNRVLMIAKKNESILGNTVINAQDLFGDENKKKIQKEYDIYMENYELEKALGLIWQFVSENDRQIEKIKLWELPKKDQDKFISEISVLIKNVVFIAWLIKSFLPTTSDKIFEVIFEEKIDDMNWKEKKIKIGEIKQLFPRVELNKAI
ncbi:methionine--tRNA ligase [Candidatus Azambacteria bacterium RIFCSPLOWO2_01_FULL_37_9]|uniref:Methionine--tRNA ligase n=1 Tax=Candidatus Azambacteria bacterium RIFCSPLOWO2_01_FULL_37_9 TaxID=1797297 RepID=A0A1F5C8D3_9BACT|nr:MAG: methionine--tRNA ligase [Candidatus Azambacteria bacterium RIFCSPLOWO2_01_FULL_37_9]